MITAADRLARFPASRTVFSTDRLVVYAAPVQISDTLCARRLALLAFPREEDTPRIFTTMLLDLEDERGPYVDWITTDPDYRRQGYASELWRGAREFMGEELIGEGATPAGEALVAKMEAEEDGDAGLWQFRAEFIPQGGIPWGGTWIDCSALSAAHHAIGGDRVRLISDPRTARREVPRG